MVFHAGEHRVKHRHAAMLWVSGAANVLTDTKVSKQLRNISANSASIAGATDSPLQHSDPSATEFIPSGLNLLCIVAVFGNINVIAFCVDCAWRGLSIVAETDCTMDY